jgi:hypothetical protein
MADPRVVTPITGRKTVALTTVPEKLVATPTYVQSVELVAQKAQASANAGIIYIGWTAGDGTQDRPMAAGDKWSITADQGQKLDLSQIYIDPATAGDGVTFTAIP